MLKPIQLRNIYITRMVLNDITYKEISVMFNITDARVGNVAHKTIERLLKQKRKTIDGMSWQRINELSEEERKEHWLGSQRVLDSMRHYRTNLKHTLLAKLIDYEEEHYIDERDAITSMETVDAAVTLIKKLSK